MTSKTVQEIIELLQDETLVNHNEVRLLFLTMNHMFDQHCRSLSSLLSRTLARPARQTLAALLEQASILARTEASNKLFNKSKTFWQELKKINQSHRLADGPHLGEHGCAMIGNLAKHAPNLDKLTKNSVPMTLPLVLKRLGIDSVVVQACMALKTMKSIGTIDHWNIARERLIEYGIKRELEALTLPSSQISPSLKREVASTAELFWTRLEEFEAKVTTVETLQNFVPAKLENEDVQDRYQILFVILKKIVDLCAAPRAHENRKALSKPGGPFWPFFGSLTRLTEGKGPLHDESILRRMPDIVLKSIHLLAGNAGIAPPAALAMNATSCKQLGVLNAFDVIHTVLYLYGADQETYGDPPVDSHELALEGLSALKVLCADDGVVISDPARAPYYVENRNKFSKVTHFNMHTHDVMLRCMTAHEQQPKVLIAGCQAICNLVGDPDKNQTNEKNKAKFRECAVKAFLDEVASDGNKPEVVRQEARAASKALRILEEEASELKNEAELCQLLGKGNQSRAFQALQRPSYESATEADGTTRALLCRHAPQVLKEQKLSERVQNPQLGTAFQSPRDSRRSLVRCRYRIVRHRRQHRFQGLHRPGQEPSAEESGGSARLRL